MPQYQASLERQLCQHFWQIDHRGVGSEAEGEGLHIIEATGAKDPRAGVVPPEIHNGGNQQGETELGGKEDVRQTLCGRGRSGMDEHLRNASSQLSADSPRKGLARGGDKTISSDGDGVDGPDLAVRMF